MKKDRRTQKLARFANITVRRPTFAFPQKLPRYWHGGNPLISTFGAAMSAVFPEGERFFIQSVRNYQAQIQGEALKKQVKAFIGQEGHHGHQHEIVNQQIEAQLGYPMAKVSQWLKNDLTRQSKMLSKRRQLAITLALEHFTAMLANQLLTKHDELMGQAEPALSDLMIWHAIEETEHKAVAFDVYQQTEGSYWVRATAMLQTTVGFLLALAVLQGQFLIHDKKMPSARQWQEYLDFLFLEPGLLRSVAPEWLAYFKPSFHPWDFDNSALLNNWEINHPTIASAIVTTKSKATA